MSSREPLLGLNVAHPVGVRQTLSVTQHARGSIVRFSIDLVNSLASVTEYSTASIHGAVMQQEFNYPVAGVTMMLWLNLHILVKRRPLLLYNRSGGQALFQF